MILLPEDRIAGVLAPLFALRTDDDLGIGDVEALRQFIDWAAGVGFRLVQMLPINEIGGDNSPYNAISAVAIEPTTLRLAPGSPAELTPEDFAAVTAEHPPAKLRKGAVKYDRVRPLKLALLEKAFVQFRRRPATDRSEEFVAFCTREKSWLDPYAFFRALMEQNEGSEVWDQWREEHRSSAAAREWRAALSDEESAAFDEREMFFRYVQWVAADQWSEIKNYADGRGVALMGDIPFGVSLYSADVFAHPEQFALDSCGGAPPEPYFKDDEFTQKWGQNWGIPLYRWDVMRDRNFDWWRQRVRGVARGFHVFRIDHVLGFYRIYSFPWRPTRNNEFLPLTWDEMRERTGGEVPHFTPRDDSNAEKCEANRHEGETYLRVVLEEAADLRVVGEDLGTVPDYVRPSLRSLTIAGFKIPQWENHQDGRSIAGAEYERVSVATYATHDHKPLRALWGEASSDETNENTEQARNDLAKIAEFAGIPAPNELSDYERGFYEPVMKALFQCESWLAIVMITDLLARKDRFNVPGTAIGSNWSQRMHLTVAKLTSNRAVKKRMKLVKQLLEGTGRL
ncbi:MAG: 4-alpha-glucanotransferase [Verrucomicrobiota bacterium]|nr:4-alpha-glucanotransferase [Verrucomicrobiota bacterium]